MCRKDGEKRIIMMHQLKQNKNLRTKLFKVRDMRKMHVRSEEPEE
jgi:hypothetical protein